MNSYSNLLGIGANRNERFVEVVERHLRTLIKYGIGQIVVDEEWYRNRYGDVDIAVQRNIVTSACDHYSKYGYFEDRLPREMVVDDDWYLSAYPDVAEGIRRGSTFRTCQQHFEEQGFKEGRLPYSEWSL
jgi:hypothetical protein